MTIKEVSLDSLHENDYNPRSRFDDAAMEDLKESIEHVGLVQPPTVRPLNNGEFEIISGTRRFKALTGLYDGDHEIPVYVRDVDDETAKWIAIAENLDREDLTPIEEARIYADYVAISVDGEEVPFDEYINEGLARDASIEVPSEKNETVQVLADRINPNAPEIRARLRLLVLPDDVQTKIEHGEITLKAAIEIARLRQLPDADRREERMNDLASDPRFEGSTPEVDALRDRVNSIIEDYKEQEEKEKDRIEEYEAYVQERRAHLESELQSAVEWYNDIDVVEETISTEGHDEIGDAASAVIDAYQDTINELGGDRITQLDDRQADLRREQERLQKNLQIVREENHERCPFCKAGIHVPDLEDRIESFEEEIERLGEEKRRLNEEREDFRDRRSDVREALNEYEDAVEQLEQEKQKVEM